MHSLIEPGGWWTNGEKACEGGEVLGAAEPWQFDYGLGKLPGRGVACSLGNDVLAPRRQPALA